MPRYDDNHFSPAAPVAHVTLRAPDSSRVIDEVPLLIDSGADVTLLPQTTIDLLGIAIETGESYQLVGFDGSISVARAVRVDLLLGRKTFKGRFLLSDQSQGVLGRDVLNHLCLVLDGPRQMWEER